MRSSTSPGTGRCSYARTDLRCLRSSRYSMAPPLQSTTSLLDLLPTDDAGEGRYLQAGVAQAGDVGVDADVVARDVAHHQDVALDALARQPLRVFQREVDAADRLHAVRQVGAGDRVAAIGVRAVGDDDLPGGRIPPAERILHPRSRRRIFGQPQ